MEERLTEFEKTLLLAILSLSKGKNQFIRKEIVLSKFPRRQQRIGERLMERLAKDNLLIKHPAGKSYKLSDSGKRRAMRLLVEGAILW